MPRFRQDKETPGGQALLPGDVSCVPVPDSGKDGKPARTGVAALQDGLRPLCPQSLSLQTLSPNPLSGGLRQGGRSLQGVRSRGDCGLDREGLAH